MQWCPQYRRGMLGLLLAMLVTTIWMAGPRRADAQMPMLEMEGRKQHLELLRMWRLVDELEIDEQQATRVFPAFRRQRAQTDSLEQRRRALLGVITRQLKEQADDEALQSTMVKVRDIEEVIAQSKKAFHRKLDKLLTPRQQARLLLFDSIFRTDLVDIVRRMRGGGPEGRPGSEGLPGRGGGRGLRGQ